jgi:hypothetical protein
MAMPVAHTHAPNLPQSHKRTTVQETCANDYSCCSAAVPQSTSLSHSCTSRGGCAENPNIVQLFCLRCDVAAPGPPCKGPPPRPAPHLISVVSLALFTTLTTPSATEATRLLSTSFTPGGGKGEKVQEPSTANRSEQERTANRSMHQGAAQASKWLLGTGVALARQDVAATVQRAVLSGQSAEALRRA